MRPIYSMAFFTFLGACASLTQEQCLAGDWENIGYNDGISGRQESYIGRHFDACSDVGVAPDVQAWLEGRAQGLPLYCTPQNAYNIGRNGDNFSPVCPATERYELARAWDWGQEYYEISGQIDDLEDEAQAIRRRITTEFATPPLTPEQEVVLAGLNSRLFRIRGEIFRLKNRLRRYDSVPY